MAGCPGCITGSPPGFLSVPGAKEARNLRYNGNRFTFRTRLTCSPKVTAKGWPINVGNFQAIILRYVSILEKPGLLTPASESWTGCLDFYAQVIIRKAALVSSGQRTSRKKAIDKGLSHDSW